MMIRTVDGETYEALYMHDDGYEARALIRVDGDTRWLTRVRTIIDLWSFQTAQKATTQREYEATERVAKLLVNRLTP